MIEKELIHQNLRPIERDLNEINPSNSYDRLIRPFHGEIEYSIMYEDNPSVIKEKFQNFLFLILLINMFNP